jgi:hypothetical protein
VLDELRTLFANVAPLVPAVEKHLSGRSFSFDAAVLAQPFPAPALFVTGRQDHIVGYGKAWSTLDDFPRATFVVAETAWSSAIRHGWKPPRHAITRRAGR